MSNVISTAVSKTLNVVLTQGSAVFNNADNSITLADIGKDIEIGDVIQIIGATNAKNNSEFTVEVITNDNNIIVNQAHAGGTTSKALVSETATVTVKLLCKWYLAPSGLGQGWVNTLANRSPSVLYSSQPNRSMGLSIIGVRDDAVSFTLIIDNEIVCEHSEQGLQARAATVTTLLPHNSSYEIAVNTNMITRWMELR